jgi:hypothetical protein
MKITGYLGHEFANEWGPFELPAAHVFKFRNGKIHEIEAIGYFYAGTGLQRVVEIREAFMEYIDANRNYHGGPRIHICNLNCAHCGYL